MKKQIFILIFFLTIFLLLPNAFSSAAGIVPCGGPSDPCTLCHLIVGIQKLVSYALKIVITVALVGIFIAGAIYMVSAGDTGMIETAKKFMGASLIGFALTLCAWLIVNVVLTIMPTSADLGIGKTNWYTFVCDTKSTAKTGGTNVAKGISNGSGTGNANGSSSNKTDNSGSKNTDNTSSNDTGNANITETVMGYKTETVDGQSVLVPIAGPQLRNNGQGLTKDSNSDYYLDSSGKKWAKVENDLYFSPTDPNKDYKAQVVSGNATSDLTVFNETDNTYKDPNGNIWTKYGSYFVRFN